MTFTPLVISTICYLWVCAGNIRQGDYPHALVWFAYAAANSGFIWYELKK